MARSFLALAGFLSWAVLAAAQPVPRSTNGPSSSRPQKQRQSVEDMFNNVARAKAERNKGDAGVGQEGARSSGFPDAGGPPENLFAPRTPFTGRFPSDNLRELSPYPGTYPADPQQVRASIVLRSIGFQQELKSLDSRCASLAQLLRDDAVRNPLIGEALPSAIRLSSEVRRMLQDSSSRFGISGGIESYQRLDQGWRKLEFKLRDLTGVSGESIEAIHQCELIVNRMSRQLGVDPQIDRRGMRDNLIVIAAQLKILEQNLKLVDMSSAQRQVWSRSIRVLRQDVLNFGDRIADFDQSMVAEGLKNLNARWQQVEGWLRTTADIHIQFLVRNLNEEFHRIHGLLWLSVAPDVDALSGATSRLLAYCQSLQLRVDEKLANADGLTDSERIKLAAGNLLVDGKALAEQISMGASRSQQQAALVRFQNGWVEFRSQLETTKLVERHMLAAIDGELAQLRGHLELQGDEVQLVSRDKVLRTAAAIESTAEFISADLNRFSSQLFPQTYRDTVLYAASDFMQSAKLFHQAVDTRMNSATISQMASGLQTKWSRLHGSLSQIQQHGLTPPRGRNLLQDQREMVEMITVISTMITP